MAVHQVPRRVRRLAVPLAATLAFVATWPSSGVAGPTPRFSHLVLVAPGPGGDALGRRAVEAAGGRVLHSYPTIGVVVASGPAELAETVRTLPGVEGAGRTRTAPLPQSGAENSGSAEGGGVSGAVSLREEAPPAPPRASGDDPAEAPQWNLDMAGAYGAHRVTAGNPRVIVVVADSGVDDTHPDIAPNFDESASVDCSTGRPDTSPGAWRPVGSDHGTHVAGTIAAVRDGRGVVGVAPEVHVAAVRVADPDGLFHAEAAVCGFMWSAAHVREGVRIVNHSYYTDPWWANCAGDRDQAVILEALRRAAAHAREQGVLSVAAAGNESSDLAHKTTDDLSPNDGRAPQTGRPLTRNCLLLPGELPGVVTVSALDPSGALARYSNYGEDVIDITAPGGGPGARGVLSTVEGGGWGYMQGTSMATPVVSGVAALVASQHPRWGPAAIERRLYTTAAAVPGGAKGDPGAGNAGNAAAPAGDAAADRARYGHGLVDAVAAVAVAAGPTTPAVR